MLRVAILLVLTSLPAACGKGEKRAAASAETSMDRYRAKLAPLAPLETEALEALAACTGPRYVDDATLLRALNDRAIPRYREYVKALEGVDAGDAAAMHERLVGLARRELAVLEKLARAVERGDGTAVLYCNREHRLLRAEVEAMLQTADAPVTVNAATGAATSSGAAR